MNESLYKPNDLYSVPKLFQPRPMPFSQQSRQKLQSAPFGQRSRQEPLSPEDLQDLPRTQKLEALCRNMPEWLQFGIKYFGSFILCICALIVFGFVVSVIVFR